MTDETQELDRLRLEAIRDEVVLRGTLCGTILVKMARKFAAGELTTAEYAGVKRRLADPERRAADPADLAELAD